jgi:hypothetical protein
MFLQLWSIWKSIGVLNIVCYLAVPAGYDSSDDVLHNRRVAAHAWEMKKKDKEAAFAYFYKNARGKFGSSKNANRAMNKWGPRFAAVGNLFDGKRIGRPPKFSPQDMEECVEELKAGYFATNSEGKEVWRGWTSLRAAAASGPAYCHKIKQVLAEGLSVRRLWAGMKAVCPEIVKCKRTIDLRASLSDEVKLMRKAMAGQHKRLPKKKLQQVIWIDAKKIHVVPEGIKVYTDRDTEVIEDPRLKQGKFNTGITLHYYSAVNALLGVVSFVWITGTTGLEKGYQTQVSLCIYIVSLYLIWQHMVSMCPHYVICCVHPEPQCPLV